MVVVDGNEIMDQYMGDIFNQVFEDLGGIVIQPGFLMASMTMDDKESKIKELIEMSGNGMSRPVCILQRKLVFSILNASIF